MGYKIGVVSQKGGVGKSTIARALATAYSLHEWEVKIADLDVSQSTSYQWQKRRLSSDIEPVVSVECFGSVAQAIKQSDNYDIFIFDGAPHATKATLEISKVSDLILIPTGYSIDDMEPAVVLANDLVKSGINKDKICFIFCRTGDSERERDDAIEYMTQTPYFIFSTQLNEKTAYRRASDRGLSVIECQYKCPKLQADKLVQEVMNKINELTN